MSNYVRERYRGNGTGIAMLQKLAQITVERGCERFDWLVLDDNKDGAAFYKKHGANALNDRRVFRLDGKRLATFVANKLSFGGIL